MADWDAAKEAIEDTVLETISTVVQLSDTYFSHPTGVLSASSEVLPDLASPVVS